MRLFGAIVMLSMTLATMSARALAAEKEAGAMWVYVGSTGGDKAKGISVLRMDAESGKLSEPQLACEARRPSFLAIHPSKKFLYATSESDGMGAVAGFSIDGSSGKLAPINSQSSGGKGACFVAVDHGGKNALVANYGDGSYSVIPIQDDGSLDKPSALLMSVGSSVNPKRQSSAHAHSINVDANDRFAFVCDLGIDQILIHRFDATRGKVEPNEQPVAKVAPGSGPRHLAFSPSGKFVYVINEMGNTVTAFAYDTFRGALSEAQTITTLPEDFQGESYCSEVLAHPSGKFLYGANRGHDSIAIFAIDERSGKLESRGHASCGGRWPRNFGIDPSGKWLIVANERSDSINVFAIEQFTGAEGEWIDRECSVAVVRSIFENGLNHRDHREHGED